MLPRSRHLLAAVGALGVLVGCGDGAGDRAGCGPSVREALDPASQVHVLPGATEPTYASDPPTSGPHQPSPRLEGLQDEPLSRPIQVGLLESGGVLVQYRPGELDPPDEPVADGVVVAPNDDLEAPVVLTGWTTRQNCDTIDVESIETFVSEVDGRAPGSDG